MLHFCAFLENLLVTLSDILHLKPKENPLGRDSSTIFRLQKALCIQCLLKFEFITASCSGLTFVVIWGFSGSKYLGRPRVEKNLHF